MNELTVHSGRIVLAEREIPRGYVVTREGRIAEVGEGEPARIAGDEIDAAGMVVLPGFVDIHCHGGGGQSFQEASTEAYEGALRAHLKGGTTSIVPAIAACGRGEREAILEVVREMVGRGPDGDPERPPFGPSERLSPEVLGAHVEGPYFSQKERGAQPEGLIGPPNSEDYLPTLEAYGDIIRVWAMAPELPGAVEFTQELTRRGIVTALGHSDASEEHVEAAVEAGASLVTHVYCAQSTFHRVDADKKLGLAEMALLLDELTVEVIADGKHLPPRLLQLVLKNKRPERVALITDAMPAAGMPPGEYEFLGDTVWVTDEVAYRADRQRYAGSVLTMGKAIRNTATACAVWKPAVQWVTCAEGEGWVAVAEMASLTPARVVGVDDRKGSIEVGKDADLVVMDEAGEVRAVVSGGVTTGG